ncbi:A24 family peptidase [Stutzerimonas kirkiae]|uniref:Prepilin type IV endopeptidase peptidase domain-containing protein n=1 Tax=Stutzerimonas kirkiae TaxID=2211392 RepID=A0A4Q9R2R6_9GAMM|nr:prepilin peptidase [Stutzerimonas kirkiae]TBU93534.1 hypothetical protein DNJ96_13930 [Stutzerimonas kirkiae]TBV01740.1 hypothetical protein DNJ95_11450 [Stutzerimonas kirkiae]TBV07438.1 hypothetical protein DNK08_12940 [Stutzerimonas kirkiae]TBV11071.1 hypothetical protein DNK01_16950 [Stutzerimonas kirkiae]
MLPGGYLSLPLAAIFWQLARADLLRRRLPNRWVLLYAGLFPLNAWLGEMGWSALALHGLAAALTFLSLLPPFMHGGIGGGDVKLATVLMLWAGPSGAPAALLATGLGGLLLGIAGWLADRCPGSSPRGLRHALSARRGVPYGVALVLGGIVVLLLEQRG